MIVKSILDEFLHEAESTRKLLNAIPDSALNWKPADISWTTAQLASHIAGIYDWYEGVFYQDVFDMATYKYDRGDISKASNIVAKFEENVKKAQTAIETTKDEAMMVEWTMVVGSPEPVFPPLPRIAAVRGFLMNHLYHHRGELIVYLRATGNKVPGMYGPVAEDSRKG